MSFARRCLNSLRRRTAGPKSRKRPSDNRRPMFERMEPRQLLAQTVGLSVQSPDSYEGYTLFAPSGASTTFLIDHDGREVNRWVSDYPPMSAYLLEDEAADIEGVESGDLLRVARLPDTSQTINAPGAAGRVELFDWDGKLKWHFTLNEVDMKTASTADNDGIPDRRLHHDIELLPNGNILMIAWERLTNRQAMQLGRRPGSLDDDNGNNGELWPGMVIEVKPNYPVEPWNGTKTAGGQIVWQWHVKDHLVQQYTSNRSNWKGANGVRQHPELINVNFVPGGVGAGGVLADWVHLNGIDYNADLDQIVLSPREFSEFWIIDHSTTTQEARGHTGGRSGMGGDLLYRWGNPEAYKRGGDAARRMSYQHDATWIERGYPGEGNILVFDNGWNRARTSYQEDYANPGTALKSSYSAVFEVNVPDNQQWMLNNRNDGSTNRVNVFGTLDLNYLDLFENFKDGSGGPILDEGWSTRWLPITGDWNNNGTDSAGFYDPQHNVFITSDVNSYGAWKPANVDVFKGPASAQSHWQPITGDWNGNGHDTVGLYNPTTRTWHLNNASGVWGTAGQVVQYSAPDWALSSWRPVCGNWDGSADGSDEVGLYNPGNSNWFLNHLPDAWGNLAGGTLTKVKAPSKLPASWTPLAGDWNGNGYDTVGVYNPAADTWYLNNRIDGSTRDLITVKNPVNVPGSWIPIVGNWDGSANNVDTVGLYDPSFYRLMPGKRFTPERPVWSYTSNPRVNFLATIISGAQRLPNGNTLIDEGTEGRFFEVTPNKQIVWQYKNPIVPGNNGKGVALMQGTKVNKIDFIPGTWANLTFRAYRYGPSYIPQFDHGSLRGWKPIERYPNYFDTTGMYTTTSRGWYLNNNLNTMITNRERFQTDAAVGNVTVNWSPVTGDWNFDRYDTVGLYDPVKRQFHLSNNVGKWKQSRITTIDVSISGVEIGAAWKPIAGDWDGDGYATVGLYDPANNDWYLSNAVGSWSTDITMDKLPNVPATWRPLAGDWNGNGRDTVGFYDPATNNWYLNNRTDGSTTNVVFIPAPNKVPSSWHPVAGDWNGNGRDSVGLYAPGSGTWYLNNRIDGSATNLRIIRGKPTGPQQIPLTGDWNGSKPQKVVPASAAPLLTEGEGENALGSPAYVGMDVNRDGSVTSLDLLIVVNAVNRPGTVSPQADVNGDGALTASDVLPLVNYLNSPVELPLGDDESQPTGNPKIASDLRAPYFHGIGLEAETWDDAPISLEFTMDRLASTVTRNIRSVATTEASRNMVFAKLGERDDSQLALREEQTINILPAAISANLSNTP